MPVQEILFTSECKISKNSVARALSIRFIFLRWRRFMHGQQMTVRDVLEKQKPVARTRSFTILVFRSEKSAFPPTTFGVHRFSLLTAPVLSLENANLGTKC